MAQKSRKHFARFAFLYFLEGAPIGFLWWALPTLLKQSQWNIEDITFLTAMLALPWTLKFSWAPWIDKQTQRWGFRNVILFCQLGMAVGVLPVCFYFHSLDLTALAGLLLFHSLCAATQDVAIDGWAMASVEAADRGRLNAAMQFGMLSARWAFGAGLLLIPSLTVDLALWSLGGLVCIAPVILSRLDNETAPRRPSHGLGSWLWERLRSPLFLRSLAIALLSGAGFEAIGAVAGPALLALGYARSEIGWFYSSSVLLMILGSWIGGFAADRFGHVRAFVGAIWLLFGLAVAAGLSHLMHWGGFYGVLLLIYVGIGLFTAISYTYFMDRSAEDAYPATLFSTFMAGTNACEAFAAFLCGRLVALWDYGPAFLVLAAVSLLSCAFFPRRVQPLAREA